ncbi:MAG: hypothetical protein AAFN93_09740 [Bacteroidota bacterium]
MNKSSDNIEQKLESHEQDLKKWILENHSQDDIAEGNVDEPSYPNWNEIAKDVSILFNELDVRKISKKGIDSLFYLIGRNWDMGWIISWLTEDNGKSFSNLGTLTEDQFYYLCEQSLSLTDEDAQSQFPASFKRFDSLNEGREMLLLRFLFEGIGYARVCALNSLYKLNYLQIEEVISKAWIIDYWPLRRLCLDILEETKSDELPKYQNLVKIMEQELIEEAETFRKKLDEKE